MSFSTSPMRCKHVTFFILMINSSTTLISLNHPCACKMKSCCQGLPAAMTTSAHACAHWLCCQWKGSHIKHTLATPTRLPPSASGDRNPPNIRPSASTVLRQHSRKLDNSIAWCFLWRPSINNRFTVVSHVSYMQGYFWDINAGLKCSLKVFKSLGGSTMVFWWKRFICCNKNVAFEYSQRLLVCNPFAVDFWLILEIS